MGSYTGPGPVSQRVLTPDGDPATGVRVKVSVVIPAFNEEKLLPACLAHVVEALAAFSEAGWEHEVVVCDNNSTDRTAEIARSAGARVVFEPVNQIARARNRGAATAEGDWLVFVDADSYPTRGLFAEVVTAIREGRCLAGGACVRMDRTHGLGQLVVWAWNLTSRVTHWVAGSFIFVERDVFEELVGFNEELFAAEEIELSRRLKRLARQRRRRIVILTRHPLITSARRLHLCTPAEYLHLLFSTVVHRGRNLKDRSRLGIWYDGRR